MEHTPAGKPNFDWVAPFYDSLAFLVFGHRLQRAQVVFLNQIPANARILIVGGGTGWLLQQVLTHCQPSQVVYLETSARMLTRASRRVINHNVAGSVVFLVGDETCLKPEESFDVIITPFVLDLFTEKYLQSTLIPHLYNRLKAGGIWLATDFVPFVTGWHKLLLWAMIRFFRLTTGMKTRQLADWQKLLAETSLRRSEQKEQISGMVSTEVWRL
jgi:ubiquinone/menaquinone biosynthesis C-methylase UbiE